MPDAEKDKLRQEYETDYGKIAKLRAKIVAVRTLYINSFGVAKLNGRIDTLENRLKTLQARAATIPASEYPAVFS